MDVSDPPAPPAFDVTPVEAHRPRRVRYVVAAVLCLGAIGFLILGGLRENIVYFRTVSEAVAERDGAGDSRLRMAGTVVVGSVARSGDGVSFVVAEGGREAKVFHRGDPPELFADDAPVVCEGRWDGETFQSDRIMIKHGSTYEPPPAEADS